jgi:Zn-dependent protease with chaperone function
VTVSYLARLWCLSLACYFLVHTVLAAAVWAAAGRAIRTAERLRPRDGARLLLALRLLPVSLAGVAVACFCVPSFLWLEPSETVEEAGGACLVAALLGAAIWIAALVRASRALVQSQQYTRLCGRAARLDSVTDGSRAWVLDAQRPVLALTGLIRQRVVISRGLMQALDGDQLAAAFRHEEAHRGSRDNLKRLALVIAPEVLPGCQAFAALERAWARVTEWAADEAAGSGDAHRRLALAEALVRVARLGYAQSPAAPLAATFLADRRDLEARVARLLATPVQAEPRGRYWAAAAGLAGGALAALLLQPGTLYSVHWLLEGLMR